MHHASFAIQAVPNVMIATVLMYTRSASVDVLGGRKLEQERKKPAFLVVPPIPAQSIRSFRSKKFHHMFGFHRRPMAIMH